MKLIGVCVALALLATTASADPAPAPRRPNPCGGNPCGGKRMPPPMPPPRRAEPDPAKTYAIKLDADDPIDGAPDAKVTIVDTYDYACPYCDKVRPTLAALKEKYGKDLRVVYKPYVVHMSNAMAGALAACAANRQLGFASVDAALWDGYKAGKLDKDVANTPCWTMKEGCPIADAAAKAAHLDMAKFKADMASCKTAVASSMADMQSFGVYAIPTFFINGRVLTGAQPQASFEAIIDEEMKKADAKIKAGTKPAKYYQQWVVEHGEKAFAPKPANPCGGGAMKHPMNPCGGGM